MSKHSYGAGTLFQRGKIWYISLWVEGRQLQSSKSKKREDAVRLRDQLLGKKARGETGTAIERKIVCGELLDDLLEHIEANGKPSTLKVWRGVIEANVRPYFGNLKLAAVTTDKLKAYRRKRRAERRSDATCNRELSILRGALRLGPKCTPPKVREVPYFRWSMKKTRGRGF